MGQVIMAGVAGPAWVLKPKVKVVGSSPIKSSYQTDMGTFGQNPRGRPLMAGTGMAGSTGDMFTGTTKATSHIPGYKGFVPKAGNNPTAVSHATGVCRCASGGHAACGMRHAVPPRNR